MSQPLLPLVVASLNLTAGLLLLAVGGTLAAGRVLPAGRSGRLAVAAFILVDTGLLASGLVALPLALLYDAAG